MTDLGLDGYLYDRASDAYATEDRPYYWLSEQPDGGATRFWMVNKSEGWRQTIMAERCYAQYGVEIVDALRAVSRSDDETMLAVVDRRYRRGQL